MAAWRALGGAAVLALGSCGEDAGLSFRHSGGTVGEAGGGQVDVAGPATGGGPAWELPALPAEVAGAGPATSGGSAGGPPVFDVESEYVESTCPPVEHEPVPVLPCDPFAESSGCAEGEGCYPMALYPADPCSPEIFGTECATAGSGVQGDPCGGDPDCQNGFACVVSSFGTKCAALCPRPAVEPCAAGLFCAAIDVDGFGVCL